MRDELQKKVDRAIKLIQSASKIAQEHGQPLEVCYSGGKDSDVILELAKMSNIHFRAIYKNTGIDPNGTIQHCKKNNVEIMKPKKNFGELILKHGLPSRRNRYCCQYLKEYKILDYAILGIRADESNARKERYKEPEQCREFSKKEKTRQYFPILNWTKNDVLEFIKEREIKLHPLYYDKKGNIDINARLGCMCCPMQSYKKRLSEFKKYPNMVKLYVRRCGQYLDNHKDSKISKYCKDGYEFFCFDVFCCRSNKQFQEKFGSNNLFGWKIDCREFLEQYFNIKFSNNDTTADNKIQQPNETQGTTC